MRRIYRRKHINEKPQSTSHGKCTKTIQQMRRNETFKKLLKKAAKEFGFRYINGCMIFDALSESMREGDVSTLCGQRKLAEKAGLSYSVFKFTVKQIEAADMLDLWGRTKQTKEDNDEVRIITNLTVVTCLIQYAERCAYWWRAAINQKNIAAEKLKSQLKSLSPDSGLLSSSLVTVDVKTGEIKTKPAPKPPKPDKWMDDFTAGLAT